MPQNIYWITGSGPLHLAIMPHPRGGDEMRENIRSLQTESVDILISLLTAKEVADLDLAKEPELCAAHGIEYRSFPIADRDVPSSYSAVLDFTRRLEQELTTGKAIVIHCRVGIGRSSLMAACVLVINGISVERAFDQIREARGCNVPDTEVQREWVESFAQRLSLL